MPDFEITTRFISKDPEYELTYAEGGKTCVFVRADDTLIAGPMIEWTTPAGLAMTAEDRARILDRLVRNSGVRLVVEAWGRPPLRVRGGEQLELDRSGGSTRGARWQVMDDAYDAWDVAREARGWRDTLAGVAPDPGRLCALVDGARPGGHAQVEPPRPARALFWRYELPAIVGARTGWTFGRPESRNSFVVGPIAPGTAETVRDWMFADDLPCAPSPEWAADETRIALWAWTLARRKGVSPPAALASRVVGVVVERGDAALAVYDDGRIRYAHPSCVVVREPGAGTFPTLTIETEIELARSPGDTGARDRTPLAPTETRMTALTCAGCFPVRGPLPTPIAARCSELLRALLAATLAAACTTPAVQPLGNHPVQAAHLPPQSACPYLEDHTFAHELFPQCPAEPFEVDLPICAGECPRPCRVTTASDDGVSDGTPPDVVNVQYDPSGRWLANHPGKPDPAKPTLECTYKDGRMATCDDFNDYGGAGWSIRRDARGRIASIWTGDSGGFDRAVYLTMTYDDAGALVGLASTGGDTTFGYDERRRLVRETVPMTGAITFRYDGAGYLAERVDGDAHTTYTHDARGRLVAVSTRWPPGPGLQADDETLDYDAADRLVRESSTSVATSTFHMTHTYDYDCK